jgi:LPP20 lipoprotein
LTHRTASPLVATLCVTFGLLAGCATAPPPPPPAPPAPKNALQAELVGAPKWVTMGCAAAFEGKKTGVCGVGGIAGMTNPALARTAAEGRGRTEIARSLKVRVKAMLKDYAAVTKGGPGNKLSNEEHLEDASKQITDTTLSGTRLQDTWISNAGTFYALVVLDTSAFRDGVKDMKQLDEATRAAIVERADKSFGELDAATESSLPPLDEGAGSPGSN